MNSLIKLITPNSLSYPLIVLIKLWYITMQLVHNNGSVLRSMKVQRNTTSLSLNSYHRVTTSLSLLYTNNSDIHLLNSFHC